MPRHHSKARTLVASILCVAAVSISTPALAGSHSAYVTSISEIGTKLGCNLIATNKSFQVVTNGLRLAGYTPEQFFLNATCELVVTHIRRDDLRPLKFAIADPSNRVLVEVFLKHLDAIGNDELSKAILNHVDYNMTTLDYLDYIYHESFPTNRAARRDLDALRREFCKRGGEYQSRPVRC